MDSQYPVQLYYKGSLLDVKYLDIQGTWTLPHFVGEIGLEENLEMGEELWSPELGKLWITGKYFDSIYKYSIIDRTGFVRNSIISDNIIYPQGASYISVLEELLDLPVYFEEYLSNKVWLVLCVSKGYSRAQIVGGLLNDLCLLIYSKENAYFIRKWSNKITKVFEVWVEESFNSERASNYILVEGVSGITQEAFSQDDINKFGIIKSEPFVSGVLTTEDELKLLAERKLEESLGARNNVSFDLAELADIEKELGNLWLVNNKRFRVQDIRITETFKVSGYYV